MTITREELGQRIKRAREDRGLTQTEAASVLDMHQPNYADYESGRRQPSVVRLIEMVELLGLDPEMIFPEFFRV